MKFELEAIQSYNVPDKDLLADLVSSPNLNSVRKAKV